MTWMIIQIFLGLLCLYLVLGVVRTVLCWPMVRHEMTFDGGIWILPRWVCLVVYSALWVLWRREYRDMRLNTKLERLSARDRAGRSQA